MATSTTTALDAERARLSKKGWSDERIEKILFEREVASPQPPPAAGAAPVQGNMTGVLGNASAVLSHARGTIPAIKADLANLRDRAASPALRAKSAVALGFVAVIVMTLGYAIYQEWQIHIVYETEIKRLTTQITTYETEIKRLTVGLTESQASKAANEAKVTQLQTDVDTHVNPNYEKRAKIICGDAEGRRLFGAEYGCPPTDADAKGAKQGQ